MTRRLMKNEKWKFIFEEQAEIEENAKEKY